MTSYTFVKRDASDPRDIGFEIEDSGRALSATFGACSVEVLAFSDDRAPQDWVRVRLRSHAANDSSELASWYCDELARRGIVLAQE